MRFCFGRECRPALVAPAAQMGRCPIPRKGTPRLDTNLFVRLIPRQRTGAETRLCPCFAFFVGFDKLGSHNGKLRSRLIGWRSDIISLTIIHKRFCIGGIVGRFGLIYYIRCNINSALIELDR